MVSVLVFFGSKFVCRLPAFPKIPAPVCMAVSSADVIPSVIFQKITEVFPLEEEGGSHALHGAPDLAAEPEAV